MTKIKAAGDTWSARVGERPSAEDKQTVVFFCTTNGQRPYRVVEVSRQQVDGQETLERLSEDQLRELFDLSVSMDYPRSYS